MLFDMASIKHCQRTGILSNSYLHEVRYNIKSPDISKIREFKNKYKNKRCFIVGNGPSLNRIDLSKLDHEYSFAVNGIFYKTDSSGYRPSFYMVEDSHVINDNLERINLFEPKIHRFFPIDYYEKITNRKNTSFFRMNRSFYESKSSNFEVPQFSTDFSLQAFCGQSVTMINLQLAYYMGFTEVYLIGMDFSYDIPKSAIVEGANITSTEDDPNHFHPDYFGKGKKWHDPKLENVMKNYQLQKTIYETSGRKIFNATVGGKLEIFDRVEFESLF